MKRFFAILLILVSIQVIGQKSQQIKVSEEKLLFDSLTLLNRELEKNIHLIQNEKRVQDSLLNLVILETQKNKKEIDIYQAALVTDDIIFGGLSTYFTLISILLSILVVAIPLINYFLVLKPNRELKKNLESLEGKVLNKIEDNFETYFKELKKKRNQKMINLLDDRSRLGEVTEYFFIGDTENLDKEGIKKVIAFLEENDDIENRDKDILNSLVINSRFLVAEKYYKSVFEKEKKKNYKYAIEYLIENNFESHIDYLTMVIKADDNGHDLLLDFYFFISDKYIGDFWENIKSPEKKEKGIKYAKLLLDNDLLLSCIRGMPIPKGDISGGRINSNRILDNPFLRETKYYDIYLKDIDR